MAILVAFIYVSCASSLPPQNELDAKFIFRGMIEKINAATIPEISETENCIVVEVSEVLDVPPEFTDWTGRRITVLVKDVRKLKPLTERIFYTNGWLFGESIAVIELFSREAQETNSKAVQDGIKSRQNDLIRERLRSSELVVAGKVADLKGPGKQEFNSEHDPLWVTATIEIFSVVKGQSAQRTLPVRFSSSRDVMWFDAPKLSVGQEGIFLCRKPAADRAGYELTEKAYFFPMDQLETIRALLK